MDDAHVLDLARLDFGPIRLPDQDLSGELIKYYTMQPVPLQGSASAVADTRVHRGHLHRLWPHRATSALPLIASNQRTCRKVGAVPISDIATFAILGKELALFGPVPSDHTPLALASAASGQRELFKKYRAGTSQ